MVRSQPTRRIAVPLVLVVAASAWAVPMASVTAGAATATVPSASGLCHTRDSLVAVAQLAERRDVAPEVAGSSPVGHPHAPGENCWPDLLGAVRW